MSVESITTAIGHVLKFFVPPLLNLLLLSVVIGFVLCSCSTDLSAALRNSISDYINYISNLVLQTFELIMPNMNVDTVSRFNPAAILQQIASAGTSILSMT